MMTFLSLSRVHETGQPGEVQSLLVHPNGRRLCSPRVPDSCLPSRPRFADSNSNCTKCGRHLDYDLNGGALSNLLALSESFARDQLRTVSAEPARRRSLEPVASRGRIAPRPSEGPPPDARNKDVRRAPKAAVQQVCAAMDRFNIFEQFIISSTRRFKSLILGSDYQAFSPSRCPSTNAPGTCNRASGKGFAAHPKDPMFVLRSPWHLSITLPHAFISLSILRHIIFRLAVSICLLLSLTPLACLFFT
jgi:hypothetical protein